MSGRPRVGWGQRGTVALETLLVLPVVALLLVGVVGMTGVVVDQLTADRVARVAARTAAVTGSSAAAAAAVELPDGAMLEVRIAAGSAHVVVELRRAVLGVEHRARATASAGLEPAAR